MVSPHAPLSDEGLLYLKGNPHRVSFNRFGAGHIKFTIDLDEQILEVIQEEIQDSFPVQTELDHGVLVPLYFLKKAGWDGKIIVLSMPTKRPEDYGRKIGRILNDSADRCALIASGDLSHTLKEDGPYGFNPAGPKVDSIIVKGLKKDTTLVRGIPRELLEEAGQCGYNSLLFALGAREGSIKVLSYEGPFGVGYLVAEIYRSSRLPVLRENV
jgi:aromatic ring-opening dioxygenase LigB subunit